MHGRSKERAYERDQRGHLTRERAHQPHWATSSFEDLVQYNDGFRPNLVGTPKQIAHRIIAYKAVGRTPFHSNGPAATTYAQDDRAGVRIDRALDRRVCAGDLR